MFDLADAVNHSAGTAADTEIELNWRIDWSGEKKMQWKLQLAFHDAPLRVVVVAR